MPKFKLTYIQIDRYEQHHEVEADTEAEAVAKLFAQMEGNQCLHNALESTETSIQSCETGAEWAEYGDGPVLLNDWTSLS